MNVAANLGAAREALDTAQKCALLAETADGETASKMRARAIANLDAVIAIAAKAKAALR